MSTSYVGILPLELLQTLSVGPDNLHLNPQKSFQFLRLPHPRTAIPSLFLSYKIGASKEALIEVQGVAPPEARSWFMGDEVLADGKLLVMTPIDPAFLLIPLLVSVHPNNGSLGIFRPAVDIFEDVATKLQAASLDRGQGAVDTSVSGKDILQFTSLECTRRALQHVCDVKEITPEITVYRFSPDKLNEYLRAKVTRLATPEVQESSRTIIRGLAKDGLMEDGQDTLLETGRIRAACDLVSQYLPQGIRNTLMASYDFASLDAYIKKEHDDAAAIAATVSTVKAKKAEIAGGEKKRKGAKPSQGVEKLKKVNVNGMAKLSSFFKKA